MTTLRVEGTRVGWSFWLLWVLAAASGWTISGTLAAALSPLDGTTQDYLVGGVVFVAAFAGVGGVSQWLILRRQVARAGWWVLANLLGLFIGFGVSFPIVMAFSELSPVVTTLFGAGFGAGSGAITGAALVWLLRQPVPGAAKQMAGVS